MVKYNKILLIVLFLLIIIGSSVILFKDISSIKNVKTTKELNSENYAKIGVYVNDPALIQEKYGEK